MLTFCEFSSSTMNPIVAVSQITNDILLLEIKQGLDRTCTFFYEIKDNTTRTIRKGKFTGPLVQLGTRFLATGNYEINLSLNNQFWESARFTISAM